MAWPLECWWLLFLQFFLQDYFSLQLSWWKCEVKSAIVSSFVIRFWNSRFNLCTRYWNCLSSTMFKTRTISEFYFADYFGSSYTVKSSETMPKFALKAWQFLCLWISTTTNASQRPYASRETPILIAYCQIFMLDKTLNGKGLIGFNFSWSSLITSDLSTFNAHSALISIFAGPLNHSAPIPLVGLRRGRGMTSKKCNTFNGRNHERGTNRKILAGWGLLSRSKIQSRSLHKPRWCARPRLGDARSVPITIFACSLLHYKVEHQTMLILGP